MSRQWFGAWGATLSDEDLACAIAALGCLWHSSDPHHFDNALSSALTRRPTEWRLRPYAPFGFHQNQLDQLPRAADLASAWKASAERHRVWRTSERALGAQLRVCDRSTLPFDPGGSWWNSVLSRAAGVDAVTWESTGQANSSRWHWPLRVGLLGGETSVRLAAEFDGAEFPELRRVVRADQTDEGLGLVVLPVDLTAALAVPPPAHRPPIHTVVVLGGGGDAPEPVVLLDAVRARFRAGAAAVLSIDPLNYGRWIRELTVELAEDAPLEIALFSSQRAVSPRGPAPLIVSGHGSLDVARISQLARATAKRVDAIEHSSLPDSTLAFEAPSFPALQRPAAHSRPPPANAPITASPAAVRSITVCPKCGRENLGAYRFCLGCGSELPRPADRKTPPGGFAVASAPSSFVPALAAKSPSAVPVLSMNPVDPASTDPWIGKSIAGDRYRIASVIGEGSLGRVYLAEQHLGGRTRRVAIKIFDPEFVRDAARIGRFRRDALAASELVHPNAAAVYEFGELDEAGGKTAFLAMEFVEGESLSHAIARGPIGAQRAETIIAQICGALLEAHDRGILHRDLEPENIYLTQKSTRGDFVKVLDFGATKQLEPSTEDATLTRQGIVVGTPPYMSPEQFSGQKLDARSDIYSLGVMAYEMVTGTLPFTAQTPWEWAVKHLTAEPTPIEQQPNAANVPPQQRAAIMKALRKNRDERQATVVDFLTEFMTIPVETTTGRTPRSAWRFDSQSSGSVPGPPIPPLAGVGSPPPSRVPTSTMGSGPAGPVISPFPPLGNSRPTSSGTMMGIPSTQQSGPPRNPVDSLEWGHDPRTTRPVLDFFERSRLAEATKRCEPRFIGATVFEHGLAPVGTRVGESALRAGAIHSAEVLIGPTGAARIMAASPFPDSDLEPRSTHRLDVMWIELIAHGDATPRSPQFATLELPASGASSSASFFFVPPVDCDEYVARIVISKSNRILQTALFRAPIGVSRGTPTRIEIETVVQTFESLDTSEAGVDASLLFGTASARQPIVTAIRGGRASLLPIGGDVATLANDIGLVLDRHASGQDSAAGIFAEANRRLFVSLARKGNQLREHLRDCEEADEFSRANRLQLVSLKSDAVLPLEVCYDGPGPSDAAVLCPHSVAALEAGACDIECAGPSRTVICPIRFWGLSKRIERHMLPRAAQRSLDEHRADYAVLRSEEIGKRDPLALTSRALWAASERVDHSKPGTIAECDAALKDAFGVAAALRVESWSAWEDHVAQQRPQILSIVAHTVQNADNDDLLEIAAAERLAVAEIEEAHVRADPTVHPIVLLLGCSTANESRGAFTVMARFRQKGAAIVVGTLGRVVGRHAASTAVALIAQLRAASASAPAEGPRPAFGDVIVNVRRKLLASGNTTVLGLVPFGDADWKL